MNVFPKSASEQAGGIYFFPRMLDKIRLHARGELAEEYHRNLGEPRGGDGFCCAFLRVDYAALRTRVLAGGTDEEIFEWCCEQGRRPGDFDRMIFNEFLRKYGWNDRVSPFLARFKAASGLAERDDIQTMMDFFDVDEGRKP